MMKEVEVEEQEVKMIFDQLELIHLTVNWMLMKLMKMKEFLIQVDQKMEWDLIDHLVKNYMVITKVFDPEKEIEICG